MNSRQARIGRRGTCTVPISTATPRNDVEFAPHPNTTDRAWPGSFCEHDIHPFPSGMTPPAWTEVHNAIRSWVEIETSDGERRRFPPGVWCLSRTRQGVCT